MALISYKKNIFYLFIFTIVLCFSSLIYTSKSKTAIHQQRIINEEVFIDLYSEINVLHHWISRQDYDQQMKKKIQAANIQSILITYNTDPSALAASIDFYLYGSVDRATDIYSRIEKKLKEQLVNCDTTYH